MFIFKLSHALIANIGYEVLRAIVPLLHSNLCCRWIRLAFGIEEDRAVTDHIDVILTWNAQVRIDLYTAARHFEASLLQQAVAANAARPDDGRRLNLLACCQDDAVR